VQVELGVLQLENLELLKRHGANAWQLHNREAEAAEKGCVLFIFGVFSVIII
jgi:hypothetical protein